MKNIKTLTLAASLPILMMGSFAAGSSLLGQEASKAEAAFHEASPLMETPELASANILSAIAYGE